MNCSIRLILYHSYFSRFLNRKIKVDGIPRQDTVQSCVLLPPEAGGFLAKLEYLEHGATQGSYTLQVFSHLLDVCSVTYEWISDDCGTQTAVGIEYNIRNMRGLGTWLRRDHGPEGTFEEAFVAGPEWESGANGALRIYLEDNGILGQVSGVGMVSGKNAVFDAFV
ncbi:hypothetical protein TURU_161499 [Turdus rufiventris]|nr:hypothetical protein TURU_161499 [Turdus rufiventris]